MRNFVFRPLLAATLLATFTCTGLFAQNPATSPVPRTTPTNWLARHEGFVGQAKKGGVDLLFLGDSITDFWRSRGSNVWHRFYANRNAANFGISGDRTQHVLWRIENGELDGITPKVVVLMIGTNNSNSDSGDNIAEGVEKIIGTLQARSPSSKVLLLAIFPRNRPTDTPEQIEKIRQVNTRIAKLDNGGSIRFLDINAKLVDWDGRVPASIMPDFLHPNERGYEIWALAIEHTLAGMLYAK